MRYFTLNSSVRTGYLLVCLLVAGLLSSCKEEDPTKPLEASGPPAVTAVRTTNPARADSTFTQSSLGSVIVIVGKNLASTQYVTFNGYRAAINPAYATETHLIVRIPDQVPTVATASSVPDELKVVNPAGETTYSFKVLPPAPVVEAVSNEYAKAGETIILFGNYFYFVKEIAFPGGVMGTEVSAAADGKSVSVKVPEGVDPSKGDIIVTSESGTSVANRRTKLFSKEGMIQNWDTTMDNFGWGIDPGKAVVASAPGVTPIENKFALINMVIPGGWGWSNDKVINLANWGSGNILPTAPSNKYDPNANIDQFDLKMEVAAAGGSVNDLLLQVWISGTKAGTVERNVPLAGFVRSTDGKWYTVSVPLNTLVTSGGVKLAKFGDLNKNEIRLVIQNPTAAGIQAALAIDNIRLENVVVR
jgi:hypothetical protein